MTELTGKGAINEEYYDRLKELDALSAEEKKQRKIQDAGIKELIKTQEVVS